MSSTILEAKMISKSYRGPSGRLEVLRGVSMDIQEGQLVCVTGPSGSGKTTLLGCLGGLLSPDSGSVSLMEQDVWTLSSKARAIVRRRHMAFVFQTHNLFPYLTALENAALLMILKGDRPKVAMECAAKALGAIGLGDRLQHYPSKLSGGEQQRVALVRASLAQARLLLADEPTGNLDANNAQAVVETLREYGRPPNAVVVVSHNPLFWEVSDLTVRLRDGVLEVPSG